MHKLEVTCKGWARSFKARCMAAFCIFIILDVTLVDEDSILVLLILC